MNDRVYSKKKTKDFIEEHPKIFLCVYTLFIISAFIFIDVKFLYMIDIDKMIAINVVFLIIMEILFLNINQEHNMSRSTAFISRDGKLYSVQLLYTKSDIGAPNAGMSFYGAEEVGADLGHNIDAAINVHLHEKELRNRRKNDASFSIALDDILATIKKNRKAYYLPSDNERSFLDKMFLYNIVNNGLSDIETKNNKYKFLILNNPRIQSERKNVFVISFDNEEGKRCTAKFSNCYDGLLQDIRSNGFEV